MFVLSMIPLWQYTPSNLEFRWLNVCYFPFATIDPPSEFEEGYEGEAFAGEEQEEPGTTSKPLALLYTYSACICFGLENCIILMTELPVALRHFSFTTPVGAVLV